MENYLYYSVEINFILLQLLTFDLDLWTFINKKIKDHRSRSWSCGKINCRLKRSKIKDHQWWSRSPKRSRSSNLSIFSWDQDHDLTHPCSEDMERATKWPPRTADRREKNSPQVELSQHNDDDNWKMAGLTGWLTDCMHALTDHRRRHHHQKCNECRI